MEQTIITFEHLFADNEQYHKRYGITETDVTVINDILQTFHNRAQTGIPQCGDVVYVKGSGKHYADCQLEKISTTGAISICCYAYTPFYYVAGDYFSTSGGPWMNALVEELIFDRKGQHLIKVWGERGENREAGSISFYIPCKHWILHTK